jgi:hypothetical protein
MDDYGLVDGRVFGQPLSANIKQNIVEINELNILANFKPEDTYLILNHSNQFKIAKISKVVELPVLEQGKKKFPKIITFTFVDGSGINFDLSKSFNGTLDDWKDMGGELFSTYRIYKLIENSKSKDTDFLSDELSKVVRTKVTNSEFKVTNEPRPNIKIKEKYLKYKAKYLQLKKILIIA